MSKGRTAKQPLWKGPHETGITFSLLSNFLVCRERFRLKTVEGLADKETFSHALEFGNFWHEAEEHHSRGEQWLPVLGQYRDKLLSRFPDSSEDVRFWYSIVKGMFPLYIRHWKNHTDERTRIPILEEVPFKVPYQLPSGRLIFLRGKFDAVFRVKGKPLIVLQENKGKGKIDEEGHQNTLQANLQTMIYLTALHHSWNQDTGEFRHLGNDGKQVVKVNLKQTPRIDSILYNVIRRPLGGWKYSLVQLKGRLVNVTDSQGKPTGKKTRKGAETREQYIQRILKTVETDPEYYFIRWKIALTEKDMNTFRERSLNPILESLCDWWASIESNPFEPWTSPLHYQFPWGVYNSISSGFRGDYFEYLTRGDKSSLSIIKTLFPELE